MKATGIVRRIDDLGRVVIPKEIRRTMRLQESDPLEIYVGDGMVCFKKYQPCVVYQDVIKDLKLELLDVIKDLKLELLDNYDIDKNKKDVLLSKITEIESLLKEDCDE